MAKAYAKLLEIVLAILLVLGAWKYSGYVHVEQYKEDQKVEQAKANKEQQDKYDSLASDYEALKLERAKNARTIVKEVEKVVAGDIVYRNICISDSGLQVINDSLSGKRATIVDAEVPAAR